MDARSSLRRVRLFLRDFRVVEASTSLADGQSLTTYLANRKSYVNVRDAKWTGTEEQVRHAVLRVDQILWGAAPDGDVPLITSSGHPKPRVVGIQLEGGLLMRAGLSFSEGQRVSDYLESAGTFIPVHAAVLLRSGRQSKEVNVTLGDVVLNQAAIQGVWESAGDLAPSAAAAAEAPLAR
jgi:hypothetical protein